MSFSYLLIDLPHECILFVPEHCEFLLISIYNSYENSFSMSILLCKPYDFFILYDDVTRRKIIFKTNVAIIIYEWHDLSACFEMPQRQPGPGAPQNGRIKNTSDDTEKKIHRKLGFCEHFRNNVTGFIASEITTFAGRSVFFVTVYCDCYCVTGNCLLWSSQSARCYCMI